MAIDGGVCHRQFGRLVATGVEVYVSLDGGGIVNNCRGHRILQFVVPTTCES